MKSIKTFLQSISLVLISTAVTNQLSAQTWSEDPNYIWNTNSNKLVGIGTTTPTAPLDINNNILLGLDWPSYGVRIKANWPGYNGGWTRGFYIANENNSKNYFGLGVNGGATAGVTNMSYAWLGPDYDKAYMSFLPNGYVGIGTTTPASNLHIKSSRSSLQVENTNPNDYAFIRLGKTTF